MIKHLCIFFFLLVPVFGFGQDKVLFTNGKEKKCYVFYKDNYSLFLGIPSNEEDIYAKRKEKYKEQYDRLLKKAKKANADEKFLTKIDSAYFKKQEKSDQWIGKVRAEKMIKEENDLKKIKIIEPVFVKEREKVEKKFNDLLEEATKKFEDSQKQLLEKNSKKIEDLDDSYAKKEEKDEEKYNLSLEKLKKRFNKLRSDKSIQFELKKQTIALNKSSASDKAIKSESKAIASIKFKEIQSVRRDNVFSITNSEGHEEVIYSPDTLGFLVLDVVEPEKDYSVEEMRRYIAGAQDGRKVKNTAALLTSAGISTVGSGLGAFYGPIAPATYIIVLGTTKQKPNEAKVAHPEYILDEAYLAGYSKAARKRKIIAAAEGGLIGLAVGIPLYWAVFRGF